MQGEQIIRDAISRSGCRCVAVVSGGDGVWDFAVNALGDAAVVVRYVEQAKPSDYSELTTMLAEGPFTRAAIIYSAEDQPHLTGEIETYPLSRIHELAASLARESAP